ncbi:MAG: hypothetical protein ACXW37_04305 [Nitrospira sp.]
MTTIWGRLEQIVEGRPEARWVQLRTAVPGNGAILTRISIGERTRIARGIEQVALANLREGEVVGITFRAARAGLVTADSIYARPEFVMSEMSESKSPSSAWPQKSAPGSMQQAPPDPESVCCCSDQPSMNTGSSALDVIVLTLMRQPLRPEAGKSIETNARLRE